MGCWERVQALEPFLPKANHLGRQVNRGPHRDDRRGPLLFALFRRVLRLVGDRRALERARCSEHEVVGDVLIEPAESRVWGSEPGRALWAAFNSSWL